MASDSEPSLAADLTAQDLPERAHCVLHRGHTGQMLKAAKRRAPCPCPCASCHACWLEPGTRTFGSTGRMQQLQKHVKASGRISAGSSRRSCVRVSAKKTPTGPVIAIVGITGAVGQEFLTVRKPESKSRHLEVSTSRGQLALRPPVAGVEREGFSLQRNQDVGLQQVCKQKKITSL